MGTNFEQRHFNLRPEGPAFNTPDRKVGINSRLLMSAEGAALTATIFLPNLRPVQ